MPKKRKRAPMTEYPCRYCVKLTYMVRSGLVRHERVHEQKGDLMIRDDAGNLLNGSSAPPPLAIGAGFSVPSAKELRAQALASFKANRQKKEDQITEAQAVEVDGLLQPAALEASADDTGSFLMTTPTGNIVSSWSEVHRQGITLIDEIQQIQFALAQITIRPARKVLLDAMADKTDRFAALINAVRDAV